MSTLQIAGVVLLVLLAVGLIRIGAQVEYSEQGLTVWLRAGVFRIPVFPAKRKKPKETKPKAAKKTRPDTGKKGGRLKLALDFIPVILDTVRRFFRKLRVDQLEMNLVVWAPDPGDAAMRYGEANALLGSVWQPMLQVFHVKQAHAHVDVDFDAKESVLYIFASLSLTIAQVLALVLVFGGKAMQILVRNKNARRRRANQGEAV